MDHIRIFSFSIGGFFEGRKELVITDTGDGLTASYSEMLHPEADRTFAVTEEDLSELEKALSDAGIERWFSHYWSPVLDGTQWELNYGGRAYGGSNSYPEDFAALSAFLEERFGISGFEPEECFIERDGEHDPREHIALHRFSVGSPNTEEMDEEELEEREKEMRQAADDLRADLDVLVRMEPRFRSYDEILGDAGIDRSLDRMKSEDAKALDADAVIAMMIYIYRSDRWCGYSEDFLGCVSDGTFAKWLDALFEKLAGQR